MTNKGKDIFDSVLACVTWIAAIVLSVLTCKGILIYEQVLDSFIHVIIALVSFAIFLFTLLMVIRR